MTPRERLTTVLRGGVPDRVPATLYEFSHLDNTRPREEPGYAALIALQREIGDTFAQARFDLGTVLGDQNVVTEGDADLGTSQQRTVTIATPKGELKAVSRREAGNITWWQIKPLIETPEDCRRWLSLPYRPTDPDPRPVLDLQRRLGDEGLALTSGGDALCIVCGMFHFDKFVMTLHDDERLILAMLESAAERLNAGLRKACATVKDVCFRICGPEYAGAPLLNPHRYFEKLVVNFDREPFRIVNESGNFSIFHCHGHLKDVLDLIAELSPSAVEPLEVLPAVTADVSIEEVKRRLGGKTNLMGAIQASELELLTPEQIDARVGEIVRAAAPGGGFGLLPTSAPIEYPLAPRLIDNYRAYFNAAHKYGTYEGESGKLKTES